MNDNVEIDSTIDGPMNADYQLGMWKRLDKDSYSFYKR